MQNTSKKWNPKTRYCAILYVGLLALVVESGCPRSESVKCADKVCAVGFRCDAIHELCVLATQLESCQGIADGVPCAVDDDFAYVCDQGVCIPTLCRNGSLDAGEQCDDGNNVDGDECRNNCETPMCGDGVLRAGVEECDGSDFGGVGCLDLGFEGGTIQGCLDGCAADRSGCTGGCGNGVLEPGEECDDGIDNSDSESDACRTECLNAWCGDGIVDVGEECDDGASNSDALTDACRTDCRLPWCGDGVLDAMEACDDANTEPWDGCNDCSISEFRVNTYTLGEQGEPSAAMADDGRFVVVFHSNDLDGDNAGVFARSYDAQGVPASAEIQTNTHAAGAQLNAAVAMAGDGRYVIAWRCDDRGGDMYARAYDAQGSASTGEFRVNSTVNVYGSYPAIDMADDGRFVVAWGSNGLDGDGMGVYGRRFDSLGNPTGDEFQLNTYTTDNQDLPAVSMTNDGRFTIAWQSALQDGNGFGVFARRYDAQGAAQGGGVQINTTTADHQFAPAMDTSSDGRMVIAWASGFQDGDGAGVYGQRLDASGGPVGGEFQINTHTAGYQSFPSVAMADGGRFVVVWESGGGQDGDGYGVFGQCYDVVGNPQGGEFQINTYTTDNQLRPVVAMAGDGRFVVAWESHWQDGEWEGVYAQRFDAQCNALGAMP